MKTSKNRGTYYSPFTTELSEMMDLYIKILTEIDKSEGGNLDE